MYEVKVSYSVILTYSTLEKAKAVLDTLFEGGLTEVTVKFVPIEDAATEQEA